jgi:hypothetical protein
MIRIRTALVLASLPLFVTLAGCVVEPGRERVVERERPVVVERPAVGVVVRP